jgi:hypothetical protein
MQIVILENTEIILATPNQQIQTKDIHGLS